MEYTYPILNTMTMQPDESGHRYRCSGQTCEIWGEYTIQLESVPDMVPTGAGFAVTIKILSYDGTPLPEDAELPKLSVAFYGSATPIIDVVPEVETITVDLTADEIGDWQVCVYGSDGTGDVVPGYAPCTVTA